MTAVAAAAWLHTSYVAIDPRGLVQAAVPPLAALAGLAAAAAALGRSTLAGLGAPFLLWATDLLTRGDVNQWAYLFPVRYPGRPLPPELLAAWQAEMHRGALLLGAGGLLADPAAAALGPVTRRRGQPSFSGPCLHRVGINRVRVFELGHVAATLGVWPDQEGSTRIAPGK